MRTNAMYPGTFDPLTHGHEDIVRRAASIFGKVLIAVASNPNKKPMFDVDERCALAREVLSDLENVEITSYSGLTVEFARDRGYSVVVRGLRAVSDFEFEFQLANMGRHLQPDIETVFMVPKEKFTFISSTRVREIAELGGDVTSFVHPAVKAAFARKFPRAVKS
jgi:pantetheine-phosphate adenylyltransferase